MGPGMLCSEYSGKHQQTQQWLGDSQTPPRTYRVKICILMKSLCALYQNSNASCRDLFMGTEIGCILVGTGGLHQEEGTSSLRV